MTSLADKEYSRQDGALRVVDNYSQATTDGEKVVFALARLGKGTADEVVRFFEVLEPGAEHKPVIATVHQILTHLYTEGLIGGSEESGDLVYNLQ